MGLMDVETSCRGKNRYFLVALSGTGIIDPLLEDKASKITNKTWTDAVAPLLDQFSSQYPSINLEIAPLSPNGRLYDNVEVKSYLEDVDDTRQTLFLKELHARFEQRAAVLKHALGDNCTIGKLQQVLGRSFYHQRLNQRDFKDVVNWYHVLITKEGTVEILMKAMGSLYSGLSIEAAVNTFLPASAQDRAKNLCCVIQQNFVGSKQIAEDEKSKKILELQHDLIDKKIDKLDGILNFAAIRCGLQNNPATTKIADLVARCAEDNATIKLLQLLDSGVIDQVSLKKVTWYSTTVRKSDEPASHLGLCPICAVRFEERLQELIK